MKEWLMIVMVFVAAACGDESISKKTVEVETANNQGGGPADDPDENGSTNHSENNLNNASTNNTNNASTNNNQGPVCGDGIVEGNEECEGVAIETCADFGFDGGTTACTSCKVDTSACTRVTCGDGVLDDGEACDDGELNGTYGYCNSNCSGQGPRCGDGVLHENEVCDAGEFRGDRCTTEGFDGGEIACTSECLLDTSSCTTCGDGVAEGDETCDDGMANGRYGACNSTCSGQGARCGDGIINGNEECDGLNTGNATCSSENAGLGSVSCSACRIDTSACSMSPQAGDVIFTEVMNNPNISYDSDGEWFEVRNLANRTVELQGCTIYSSTSVGAESFDVLAGAQIAQNGYFVFTRSNQAPFVGDYTYNALINLNNATDTLELYCDDPITGQSELIDEIAWDDGVTFPDLDGASMSLDPFYNTAAQNDVGSRWCASTTLFGVGDRGTPGSPNDACL